MEKEGDVRQDRSISEDYRRPRVIGIPRELRFPITWTLFFIILGIIIQSIGSKSFVFADFFSKNYMEWINKFGTFTDTTLYESTEDLIRSLFGKWYYFFYTGGLLSLIWGLISWITHLQINLGARQEQIRRMQLQEQQKPKVEKDIVERLLEEKKSTTITEKKAEEKITPNTKTNIDQNVNTKINQEPLKQSFEEKKPLTSSERKPDQETNIDYMIKKGFDYLEAHQLKEAEETYNAIRQVYNPALDISFNLFKKIDNFHEELLKKRQVSQQIKPVSLQSIQNPQSKQVLTSPGSNIIRPNNIQLNRNAK